MEINSQIQSLLKSGKGNQAEALIPQLTSLNTNAQECTLKLTKDARKDNSLNALKLEESIEESCSPIWPSVKELLFE